MTTNESLRTINAKLAEVMELLENIQAINESHCDQTISIQTKAADLIETLTQLRLEAMSA